MEKREEAASEINKAFNENKKGRVIGQKGKIREMLEETTNCFISVYGSTVAVIGTLIDITTAKGAIEMLLEGANISDVERFLFKRKKGKEFEL